MNKLQINGERMLADLNSLRSFGACGTGVKRRAFSEPDIASRKWLANRMSEAGLVPHVDDVGNVFGLPGDTNDCILVGSHSDTQPEGGWLDGAYGVAVGLEVARASLECGSSPIACVSFQDEEGRFSTLTGSRVWTGQLSLGEADIRTDTDGLGFAQARRRAAEIGTVGKVSPERFRAYLEVHIEQGPVLDIFGDRIGVVEGIVGIRTEKQTFIGQQNHAGTTPMDLRKDALQGLARFNSEINARFADVVTDKTVWTIGHVALHPNATSVVPGKADFTIQWRDLDDGRLDKMRAIIHETARHVAGQLGLEWTSSDYSSIPATRCDDHIVKAFKKAAELEAPGKWRLLNSGALHDAANVSFLMPMGMLFVPSIKGISHNFEEDTALEDLLLGAETMARAINILTA